MQNQLESKAYAGFFVRLIAYFVDMLIAALVVGMVKMPFSLAASSGADFLKSNFIFDYSFLDVLGYVGIAAYFVLLTYFAHTTVGKMLFHLEVECEKEWTFINILYRETIGRFLSSLLNIGYLAVIVQKEKQGFHDMLCDTHVVYKNMYQRKRQSVSPSFVTMDDIAGQSEVQPEAVSEHSDGQKAVVPTESELQTADAALTENVIQPADEAAEANVVQPADEAAEANVVQPADKESEAEVAQQADLAAPESQTVPNRQTSSYYQPEQKVEEHEPAAFEGTESHPLETENIE